MYAYRYNRTTCPHCGADLTVENSVTLEAFHEGFGPKGQLTRLDSDGRLIDVFKLVADGFHAGTSCAACGFGMIEYEQDDFELPPAGPELPSHKAALSRLSSQQLHHIVEEIQDILWEPGKEDAQWEVDTIEHVADVLVSNGLMPNDS